MPVLLAALAGSVLVAAIEYVTGSEVSISIAYLVPVTAATLGGGRRAGVFFATLCAVLWLAADIGAGHRYSHWIIPWWNAAVRFGFFALHAILLAGIKRREAMEKELSLTDPLTGAANWRALDERASLELARSARSGKPITSVFIDLDDFKSVNDEFGHETGNRLLKMFAATIMRRIRAADMAARVGGDEFVVIFPEMDFDGAESALSDLRAAISDALSKEGHGIGFSMGAVTFESPPGNVEDLLKPADELMFEVKRKGKNAVLHEARGG